MEPIISFSGEYRWLSNFSPVDVTLDGIQYKSIEHAYQSAKSDAPEWKEFCQTHTAGQVKRASREIEIIPEWNSKKLGIMKELLNQKFADQTYRDQLIATGIRRIVEGNNWGDVFWGVDSATMEGHNHLGKLIMEIRDSIVLANRNIY